MTGNERVGVASICVLTIALTFIWSAYAGWWRRNGSSN
jgi:hypothetical protein